MLGNFSIGEYFKSGAVDFAIELMTEGYGIPLEKFAAAVHDTDDETRKLWEAKGIPPNRVYAYGDDENWWGPAGDEGPCGPCSELHYDYGAQHGCLAADCVPNCKNALPNGDACDRYVELWNLVFMQFYHHLDGSRTDLPAPSVDTGMGFERLARIMQGVDTCYETDLFAPLVAAAERVSGRRYGEDDDSTYALRVISEHGRSVTFLIADGVVPANEGRGYVLRRVIRRAIRYGRRLGIEGRFLSEIADATIEKMGGVYPELVNNREFIHTALGLEEDRFEQAFQSGFAILTDALEGADALPGEVAFRLWDTHGFPVEMTREIAAERGVGVDMNEFERRMDAQRERARAGARFGENRAKIRVYESMGVGGTAFLGYDTLRAESVIVGMIRGDETVQSADAGDEVEIALLRTPFYPEGGGQVGDAGEIAGANGRVSVRDAQEAMPGLIIHFGTVSDGSVGVGDSVDARVDPIRREDTARNHTATHMLHAALRQVLGAHVRQAGSLVAPDRLRFDFSHVQPVTDDELWQVQHLVNEKIRQNARVLKSEDSYQEALRRGALAFFGDRYGERVRLVEIANGDAFSFEVCGGTHVERAGEVGAVYVLGESSIGAGMRRIEAVSGRAAERLAWDRFRREERLAAALQTTPADAESRVQSLLDEIDALRRERETMERRMSLQRAESLLSSARDVDGVKVLAARVDASGSDSLREMGDYLRDKLGSGVIALGAVVNERPILAVMVTDDLISGRGLNAANIARSAARLMGGGGGGRPGVAQAGGRDPSKLDAALALVPELAREAVSA